MKGQFLERPTLIPVTGSLVLEGISHRGDFTPGVLVLPPPPSEGSGMDHVVGAEIAFAVARAGHPCLRFNYRGVGASQGTRSSQLNELLDDALAAWELAKDNSDGAAPLLVTIGGSDRVGVALGARVELAAWALIHPNLEPFEAAVPTAVILPELDPVERRRGWSNTLDDSVTVIGGADRAYHRNLPQVGKAIVKLLERVRTAAGTR